MNNDSRGHNSTSPIIFTVGHSNHAITEFIDLLTAHGITYVADVRSAPGSRHNPQFNKAALANSLKEAGLKYAHLPGLGGMRRANPDSVNTGLKNDSFRGYADYMQTPEFESSLDELVRLAETERIAIMCAEADPVRCHRSFISDALSARKIAVEHIISAAGRQVHVIRPFAVVCDAKVIYPDETLDILSNRAD